MIRVVLADDQRLVRSGLAVLVDGEEDLAVVGEASDGREAIAVCRRTRPDVVLMDIRMPVLDGIAATAALTADEDGPRVIVLTTFDTEELVFGALRAGASGFLLKDAPADELFAGIRTVAAGEAMLAPTVTAKLIAHFVAAPHPTHVDPSLLDRLTGREQDVLRHIAAGRSNQEIAGALVLGEATVKTHVGRIFEKLGVRDRAQAVIAAYESGLVVPGRIG